jgi:tetratricopeptide (TPR) repeat protein
MTPFSASRAGWMLALALSGAALAVPRPVRAQEPGPAPSGQVAHANADSFDAEFDQAQSFTRRRMWKSAHAAWLELLRKHAGAIYVRPRLPEIRELVRKCAFWQVTREPDAKICISGKLVSFDRSTGNIELEYRPEQLGDFAQRGELRALPMHFKGPYTLEVVGRPHALSELQFILGLQTEQLHAARFGLKIGKDRASADHQLIQLGEGSGRVVDFAAPVALPLDEPVEAGVSVGSRVIQLRYGGKVVATAPRNGDDQHFGCFSFAGPVKFDTLTIRGVVDTGWIDGMIDAKVEADRKAFFATWKEPAELSAWVDERPVESRLKALERLMGTVSALEAPNAVHAETLKEIEQLRESRQPELAIQALQNMQDERLPPATRSLLLAICWIDAGRPGRALGHLVDRAKLVPPTFPIRFVEACLLGQVERDEEAITLLRELETDGAEPALVQHELAERLLACGRVQEALEALQRGLNLAGSTSELEALRTQLAKANLGPGWKRSFTQRSEHFQVDTNVDTPTAVTASRVLEETWQDCQRVLGRLPEPTPRTRVFVFSGRASYDEYIHGIVDDAPENTAGIYSRLLDQIVVLKPAREADMLRTLRHECVHRYVELALGRAPRWYDEGLAEYISACRTPDGKWDDDAMHPVHAEALRDLPELVPLPQFVRQTDAEFLGHPELHYMEAWAFVHFLRRGRDPAAIQLEQRLWKALQERSDLPTALEVAFDAQNLKPVFGACALYIVRIAMR